MVPHAAAAAVEKENPNLARARLSKVSFFADFWVYPLAAAVLACYAYLRLPGRWSAASLAIVAGLVFWTLIEYLLHRCVLHHVPLFREHHEDHHDNQKALVGTPTWMSFSVFLALVELPAAIIGGPALGSAFAAGTMLGYLWYVGMHYAMHHWKARPGGMFAQLKYRHALHHHFDDMGNFGVTSGFWDYVFRTNVALRRNPRQSYGIKKL